MELSLKERDRISVLRQVSEGVLAAADGVARFGVTDRHFWRRRLEAAGDEVFVHGLRGRRSNWSLPSETRGRVLAMARDPDYTDFGATLLAERVEQKLGVRVSEETLRAWRMGAGLWQRKRKRVKHRSRRPRRAARGELLQWAVSASVPPRLAGAAQVARRTTTVRAGKLSANCEPSGQQCPDPSALASTRPELGHGDDLDSPGRHWPRSARNRVPGAVQPRLAGAVRPAPNTWPPASGRTHRPHHTRGDILLWPTTGHFYFGLTVLSAEWLREGG